MGNLPQLQNWAGNVRFSSKNVFYPQSVKEVQDIVRNSDHITALGSRHSFNTIADTTENHICLDRLDTVISLDPKAMTVTIEAGIRYSQLAPYLHRHGWPCKG